MVHGRLGAINSGPPFERMNGFADGTSHGKHVGSVFFLFRCLHVVNIGDASGTINSEVYMLVVRKKGNTSA